MDISGINHINGAHGIKAPHFAEMKKETAETTMDRPIQDEIEISTTARRLSATTESTQASETGDVRYELVNRIRDEIANGTYDTPERFDVAMERLLSRLG